MTDHERGCQGREYTCTCGYDDKQRALIETLTAALERIEGKDSYIDSTIRSDSPNGERPVICGELGMIAARALAAAKEITQ